MGRHFDRRGKQRQKSAGRRAEEGVSEAPFEVTILRWAHGGEGVALPEKGVYAGRVTFVADVVPGDDVEVVAREAKARWVRAEVVRVVRASAARRAAKCAHQAACGGCPWMPGTVAVQAESRAHILTGELRKRLGAGAPVPVMRETPAEFGYRQRLRMKAVDGVLGFTGRGSHTFVPIERCEIADERINTELARRHTWLPGSISGRVTLLAGDDGVAVALEPEGEGLVKFGPATTRVRFGEGIAQRLRPEAFAQANAAVVGQVLADIRAFANAPAERAHAEGRRPYAVELFAGSGTLSTALWSAGYDVEAYEVAPEAKPGFEETRDTWAQHANHPEQHKEIDPGTFLSTAAGGAQIDPGTSSEPGREPSEIDPGTSQRAGAKCSEIDPGTSPKTRREPSEIDPGTSPNTSETKANHDAGTLNATSVARPEIVSGTWHACDLLGAGIVTPPPTKRPDLVLVDPPRTGAWPIVPWLRLCGAERILYLACDLAAGLRDVTELCKERGGWQLSDVVAYDMFTHSGHQEVLFVLERVLTAGG